MSQGANPVDIGTILRAIYRPARMDQSALATLEAVSARIDSRAARIAHAAPSRDMAIDRIAEER